MVGGGVVRGDHAEQSQSTPELFISGAGIKGPLAYATVELYSLDAQFDGLYDPQKPLAVATTNAYAEISGLKVPDVPPPYVLVIDGSNAIDRNTGVAPVITKLVTIITPEALQAGQSVYATPYTTLAYHMLRKGLQAGSVHASTATIGSQDSYPDLVADLAQFNYGISRALGFGMPDSVDIFTTPPIITEATTTVAQQDLVVNYRAAIEALSSMVYQMSQSSAQGLSTDTLLERIALDLYSDGVVDNSNNGQPIGGVDTTILSQDPMPIAISNTNYRVRDIALTNGR